MSSQPFPPATPSPSDKPTGNLLKGGGCSQERAPLFEQLQHCAQRRSAPFHTPGHKTGRGLAAFPLRDVWGAALLQADLPELPELDNLFAPSGVIAEAQALAAEAFGAEQTWFLANGSTAGVMAAILATCGPGDAILLPRTVHQSVVSGLILSGATPIFLTPAYDAATGLVGGLTAAAVAEALAHHRKIKAVMVVSPSYEGVCGETAAIAHCCHQHQIPLLVDEAHGPHFGFHPNLPQRAIALGADLAVQSTHKVLSALTQAAMVHISGNRIDPNRLTRALALVQSTSPSYLLLASLDVARRQMALSGRALMGQTLALASDARRQISQLPGLQVLALPEHRPGFVSLDPTRLTVDVSELGLSGFEADEFLCERGVIAELPSLRSLTFIVSLGNCPEDIQRLVSAFQALSMQYASDPAAQTRVADAAFLAPMGALGEHGNSSNAHITATEVACTPREAFYGQQQSVAIADAIGKPSAETICPYPPGIPALLPGEIITPAALDYLQQVQQQGGIISGCADDTLATLRVVMQPEQPSPAKASHRSK